MVKGKLLSRKGASSSARTRRAILLRSRRQEQQTAMELGGATVSGSGNRWHSKGDVRSASYLVECKRTDKASYRLVKETLRRHRLEALKAGKTPLMQIEIDGDKYAAMDWQVFLDLTERASDEAALESHRGGARTGAKARRVA